MSNDTLGIEDGNFVVLPPDADSDSTNELLTGAQLVGTNLELSDAGGTTIVDLTSIANTPDADSDSTNEYNTGAGLVGQVLQITDGGGTQLVDLSSLGDDDDADPVAGWDGRVGGYGTTSVLLHAGSRIVPWMVPVALSVMVMVLAFMLKEYELSPIGLVVINRPRAQLDFSWKSAASVRSCHFATSSPSIVINCHLSSWGDR